MYFHLVNTVLTEAKENGVGGPARCEEAAAKRKPDRAKRQAKRRTSRNWTVGPTLMKRRGGTGQM
jgi:hypothetical protein